ncbi:hypothetical protein [Streptomyces sp. BE303]|uniref:hypothetical protein n=1 Tax=Streptomyces sp. BE303 TaxID=3002528 RepID=UPI002E77A8F4|nr:hypothetical protein [Streptomyces sp. BE303]MED7950061.1 hypothetical protein [Streptomyces sp. BE303]
MSSARRRRRLPDEVRTTVVRAVLCLAFTLVGIVLAALSSYADSWLMTPALMAMGLGVFGTMWCLLEILISRQVAAQRLRGPDSASPMAGSRAPAGPRPAPRPGPPGTAPPPAGQPRPQARAATYPPAYPPPHPHPPAGHGPRQPEVTTR